MKNKIFFVIFLLGSAYSQASITKGLDSAYLDMFIAKGWVCLNIQPNHICHPGDKKNLNKISVFISGKMGLKSDELLSDFDPYLFDSVKKVTLNNHKWFELLPRFDSSKVYILREQKTICCEELPYLFHVNVTFILDPSMYSEYITLIIRMLNSMVLKKENVEEIRKMFKNQEPDSLRKIQEYRLGLLSAEDDLPTIKLVEKDVSISFLVIGLFLIGMMFFVLKGLQRKKRRKLKRNRKRLRKRK